MINVFRRLVVALVLVLGAPLSAHAQLTVDITKGNTSPIPIAVVPFGGDGIPVDVAQVIDGDLTRSGRLAPLGRSSMPQ